MGFLSKLFGKKDEEKPADDQTMENPAAAPEDKPEATEEETEE